MIKKIIIDEEGNIYYYKQGDFNTKDGNIKEKDIKNGLVKSNLGRSFIIFDADFIDNFTKIKRGPALMHPKDIGAIITTTGIGVNSKVLDAGTGQGGLASFLSRIGCNVISYEKNKEFYELSKKNIEDLKLRAVLKNKDIYEGIDEEYLDLVVLDLLEPWKVLEHAYSSLKSGGFFVAYLPTITQVIQLTNDIDKTKFYLWKVSETIERPWHSEGLKVRPENMILGHTAFILFARRI